MSGKHMLRVSNPQFREEAQFVYMHCENCPKYLRFDRETMFRILTGEDKTSLMPPPHEAERVKRMREWVKCEPYLFKPTRPME